MWEYTTRTYGPLSPWPLYAGSDEEDQNQLTPMAQDGWELVTVLHVRQVDALVYYWRRPVEQLPHPSRR